jgi:hypothetical protein
MLADLPARHPQYQYRNPIRSQNILGYVTPSNIIKVHGILTCCPSTTPFGLALGPTNPGMITIAQETLDFRCWGISPQLWLLMPTFSLPYTPRQAHAFRFSAYGTLSYHAKFTNKSVHIRISSVLCLAPLNFRREVSRLVSCYALFKGWLLLSQPPRCIRNFTSFATEHRFRDLR